MGLYVKWCNSREECATCNLSKVRPKTRKYSEKSLCRISCFLDVSSRLLRTIHFLKAISGIFIARTGYILEASGVKVLEGGVRFLPLLKYGVSATPAPRRLL